MCKGFIFDKFKIIPSIRRLKELNVALNSKPDILLLSEVHIGNLPALTSMCHEKNKLVLVNIDMIGGISGDQMGIKLLKDLFKVDGVMSASTMKVNIAKSLGLYTIQRFFLIDSRSYETSLKSLKTSKVDAIEVLPAPMAPHFVKEIRNVKDIPLLAGGFIKDKDTLNSIREAGFDGVTTSERNLWSIENKTK
ncbi:MULTISPECIES: glycerol-3-phosphate responsive antiterminator [Clostridium]|uniref:glycerol-3-phosphate responsive antiterminator n=1 Tax=Clostridium TaxID=1485 RepID=UPI000A9FC599|nr:MULTISPECIES: glycerol-3-phosphate responsive antiterminator [Clostridium]